MLPGAPGELTSGALAGGARESMSTTLSQTRCGVDTGGAIYQEKQGRMASHPPSPISFPTGKVSHFDGFAGFSEAFLVAFFSGSAAEGSAAMRSTHSMSAIWAESLGRGPSLITRV